MHPVLYGAQPDEGVTRLNEGAWLVRLDSSLLFLSNLIRIAHEEKLPHRVLFFDKEPSFVATKQPPGK